MKLLTENEIRDKLNELSGWSLSNNSIVKEFQLDDFSDAIAFIVKVGIEAEKIDHHPDILLYGWNKVRLTLSTHNAGGLTEKDFNLAHSINNL